MPITTVTKMTGPVTALISWMNASASHWAFSAASSHQAEDDAGHDRDHDVEPQLPVVRRALLRSPCSATRPAYPGSAPSTAHNLLAFGQSVAAPRLSGPFAPLLDVAATSSGGTSRGRPSSSTATIVR